MDWLRKRFGKAPEKCKEIGEVLSYEKGVVRFRCNGKFYRIRNVPNRSVLFVKFPDFKGLFLEITLPVDGSAGNVSVCNVYDGLGKFEVAEEAEDVV